MRVERLQRPRKEAAGSRHEPDVARQTAPADVEPTGPPTEALMEEVLRRENLRAALKRVQANKGAPGVDGMTVATQASRQGFGEIGLVFYDQEAHRHKVRRGPVMAE